MAEAPYPEEDEFVLCTVTGIRHHSIFCELDEYGRSGMMHISEVASGRVRNIRDYVQEGRKIVCKVLRIDKSKGHIDLSLRRVSEGQRKAKMREIKEDQLTHKIIELVAKDIKQKPQELYEKVADKVFKKYDSMFDAFLDVAKEELSLSDLGVPKKEAKALDEHIRSRIKPPQVEISGDFTIHSTAPDGVDRIRKTLEKAEKEGDELEIKYTGAGTYRISITAEDYKTAEKILEKAVDKASKYGEKHEVSVAFTRAA